MNNISTYEEAIKEIESNPYNIRFIPEDLITEKLCHKVIDYNYGVPLPMLSIIPKKFIDYRISIKAVNYNPYNILYVPIELLDNIICELAFEADKYTFKFIPDKFKTEKMCKIITDNYTEYIKYVPEEFINKILPINLDWI